ncbi:D-hexose-6-phosphate mutarotase [Marinobacterium aestuariivivens]|uniref:glucose-6-phosphate 1-epimerase n=1 Tax=Marinobacterium aestuariivivens TaxID=1698799 RepID=A0ABW2A659_9GAMM
MHYRPAGERPLLWLSDAVKAPPSAIRGGVPLCWPWFGPHPGDKAQPAHGVARTGLWQWRVLNFAADALALRLEPLQPLWPGLAPVLSVQVRNRQLALRLETLNSGSEHVSLGQALHSYLAVGDVARCELVGLDGCDYLDKLQNGRRMQQNGAPCLTAALDRVYCHQGVTELVDPVWQRRLRVTKEGSGSTVVWNPGDGAGALADVGQAQRSQFVCVEAANTGLDPVTLAPGERHCLATNLSILD